MGVSAGFAGGAGGAAYYATGDINSALMVANLASLPANVLAQRIVPCFPAGTPVLTPTGHTLIENLQPGDLVLSRPEQDPGSASPTPQRIEEVFVRAGRLFELVVAGRTLRTTPEHPFFVREQGWTPAGELEPGDLLSTPHGEWLAVEQLTDTGRQQTVYNFRVAEYATYFIAPADLAFDVWVHNTYRSSLAERIAQTPAGQYGDATQAARGSWTGARGRSTFIPANTAENAEVIAILNSKGVYGIKYRNGIPSFTRFTDEAVPITGMTTNRANNFLLGDLAFAKRLGITRVQATDYRNQMGLTWHELNNTRGMQLIPAPLNAFFDHLGGVAELRR